MSDRPFPMGTHRMNPVSALARTLAVIMVAAGMLVGAGATPAHATSPGPLSDLRPTPPPVLELTPASDTKPPGFTDQVTPGAGCGDWYREKNYAESWPGLTMWWEAQCVSVGPDCWPECYAESNPDRWIDFFYWDGSQAVFYGEHYSDAFSGL